MKKIIPDAFSGDVFLNNQKEILPILAQSQTNCTVLVTGSIYFIGEVFAVLKDSGKECSVHFQDIW